MKLAQKLPEGLRDGLRHLYNRHLAPHDESRRLLVVGGGTTGLPGPLLAALHTHGFPVTLVSGQVCARERAWVDRVVRAELSRPEAVLARVREEHRLRPVRGVLTGERVLAPLAARLSQALGLGFSPPEAVARTASAEQLAASLVPSGLPLAVTPAARSGTEHSVLSVVAGDAVSHLVTVDTEWVAGASEALLHTAPSRMPAAQALTGMEVATQAILALGLQGCAVHTRLRTGTDGALAVVDVAGVPAGDGLGLLVQMCRGVDLVRAAGEAALGKRPPLQGSSAPAATLGFLVPAARHIQRGPVRARPPIPGLVDLVLRTGWGDEVRRGERVGHVLTVGRTPEESRAAAEQARVWVSAHTGLELLPLG